MLLARGETRREDAAVRVALGASRGQLARSFLCESLLLAVAGGGCGALLASWAGPLLLSLVPEGMLPRLQEAHMDAAVLAFSGAISLLVSAAVGLLPALRAGRAGAAAALRSASSRGGIPGFGSLRALVAAEVALSVALLVGSALLLRSFVRLASVDPGFVAAHVLTLNVSLPEPGGCEPPACLAARPEPMVAFHQAVLERLRRLPGVDSTAAVNWLPLGDNLLGGDFAVEGRTAWPAGLVATKTSVTPHYFRTMGIRLLRGRTFSDADSGTAPGVAIVSQSLAGRLWPGEDGLGRHVKIGIGGDPAHEPWRTVVGVVADVRQETLASEPAPTLYSPLAQAPLGFLVSEVTYVLRTAGDPAAMAGAATREIHGLDPALPVTRVRPLDALVSVSLAAPRLRAALFGTFACLGLGLAGAGIFGQLAYSVSRRSREIGLRMALGAAPATVVSLVVRQALATTLIGLVVGLCTAVLLVRTLGGFLYRVTPGDPLAYAVAALALLAVALLASWAPARRATRVDPVEALRSE